MIPFLVSLGELSLNGSSRDAESVSRLAEQPCLMAVQPGGGLLSLWCSRSLSLSLKDTYLL